jgi:tetratricopeptide (TPR) repeat protein
MPREFKAATGAAPKARSRDYAVIGVVCLLVLGVYAWIAKSGWMELGSQNAENTYYNLLVEGFRSNQLNLKREVPSGLAQLANPYDPVANRPYLSGHGSLLDVSYYKGKLYLYFGVTPALVLFWPYAAMTGQWLLHKEAVVIFFGLGFLANMGLLWAVWRRYFPRVRVWVVTGVAVAAGLASFAPAILQRCDVYEVAISCGCGFTMVTLLLLWHALHAARGRAWWLAGASLAYGLAIGARPSLLFGAVILLMPVAWAWRERAEGGQRPPVWALLLAAALPMMLIGGGLMLYNTLRFEDPLEFGQRYQLNDNRSGTLEQFDLRYFWYNLQVGFWGPANWSGRFPYVQDIALPSLPAGYAVEQLPFGILTNVPLVWLALGGLLAWRGRLRETGSGLRWFVVAVGVYFGATALILCLHNSMTLRYELEFLAPLVLLAAVGILGIEGALAEGRAVWQQAARWGWGLLLCVSVWFNFMVMVDRASAAHLHAGLALYQKRHVEKAIVEYERALKLKPDNAGAHTCLGAALLRQGKLTQANKHLREAVRIQPDSDVACANLGVSLFEQGKMHQAIGYLREALRLNPKQEESLEALENALVCEGQGLAAQGKWDEAIKHYERATRMNADSVPLHNSMGMALLQRGRRPEAVRHFKRAVGLNPHLVPALNALALLAATETNRSAQDLDEAVRFAERACELTTNSVANYLDTLGMVYAEAGRFKEAVEATGRAAALARGAGNTNLAERIERRMERYRDGRPYRATLKVASPEKR